MKLGDLLAYGLSEELHNINRAKSGDMLYLKSSIIMLYFENLIKPNMVNKIRELLKGYQAGIIKTEGVLETILNIIADSLKERFHFSNFEEMIEEINHLELEEAWVLSMSSEVFELIPDVCLIDEKLFFMKSEAERPTFGYLDTEKLGNKVLYWYELKENEYVVELSHNYSRIYGYNKEKSIIYLKPVALDDVYVEYHVATHQERIIHNQCLGMIDDILVIEVDGNLAFKRGEDISIIKEKNNFEAYTIDGKDIYVTPSVRQPGIFKPYWISINGLIIPSSYQEAVNYMWNLIKSLNTVFYDAFMSRGINMMGWCSDEVENGTFTLRALQDYFENKGNPENNKECRMFYFLVKTLSKYLDMDSDVLDYFYIIYDASRKCEKHFLKNSISQSLFLRIQELDASGQLEQCIYEPDKFRDVLLEDVYWTDERLKERWNNASNSCMVGGFEINGDDIYTYTAPVNEGVFMGNLVMMNGESHRGIVAYNLDVDKFLIQYTRLMTEDELIEIVERFNIEGERLQIIVEDNYIGNGFAI